MGEYSHISTEFDNVSWFRNSGLIWILLSQVLLSILLLYFRQSITHVPIFNYQFKQSISSFISCTSTLPLTERLTLFLVTSISLAHNLSLFCHVIFLYRLFRWSWKTMGLLEINQTQMTDGCKKCNGRRATSLHHQLSRWTHHLGGKSWLKEVKWTWQGNHVTLIRFPCCNLEIYVSLWINYLCLIGRMSKTPAFGLGFAYTTWPNLPKKLQPWGVF